MLSKHTVDLIVASKPIIEANGTKITNVMYGKLQKDMRVRKYFKAANAMINHLPGDLAKMIISFIDHLEDLDELETLLRKISAVHVIHDIPVGGYVSVGEALIASMKEVLVDCDSETIDAWIIGYMQLAARLIQYDTEYRCTKNDS